MARIGAPSSKLKMTSANPLAATLSDVRRIKRPTDWEKFFQEKKTTMNATLSKTTTNMM